MTAIKRLLFVTASLFVVCGFAAAAAEAREPPNWKINGAFLGAEVTKNVGLMSTTAIEFKVPLAGVVATCKKSYGSGTVVGATEGATPGTGTVTNLVFEECSTAVPKCALSKVNAIDFIYPTVLARTNEAVRKVVDRIRGVRITLEYEGAECEYKGLQEVVGTTAGAVNNAAEALEFKFPPLEGSNLKFFGETLGIGLVGSYKLKSPEFLTIGAE